MGRDGIAYLAVADADAGRRIPFAFLAQLESSFHQMGGSDGTGGPMPSNLSSFSTTMDELRHQFNETPDADPIQRAQAELGSVKDIITKNVEQILSRGEQLDLLVDRTDSAAHQSLAFRRRAVSLRREMWWRNTRIVALMCVCGLVRAQQFRIFTDMPGTLLLFVSHAVFISDPLLRGRWWCVGRHGGHLKCLRLGWLDSGSVWCCIRRLCYVEL